MTLTISLFLTFLKILNAGITYQSGYYRAWDNTNNVWGATESRTVTFQTQFTNIPQVSINPVIIQAKQNTTSQELGYLVSITSITTSNFVVTLYVAANTIVYLAYYWVAVDDKRIEILCNFNVANPQSTILQHNNANANYGIIILTSFYGKTSLDFTLSLGEINSTTVKVNIVQNNMKSLGYIVILGPSGFFNIENQIIQNPKDQSDSNVYKSRQVVTQANIVWLYFFQYFTFTVNSDMKLQLQPNIASSTYYLFCTWDSNPLSFSNCAHQCASLNFTLSTFTPLLADHVRVSSLVSFYLNNILEFKILEIGKTYSSQTSNDYIIVPNNLKVLTFEFSVRCDNNYKITSYVYKCSTCAVKYLTTIRNCYCKDLSVTFFARYNQQFGAYQQIYITMTSIQVQVYQTLLNQVSESILIGEFTIA